MTSPCTEGPMVPPAPAARPAKNASTKIVTSRSSTVSRNGSTNMPPKDTPVSTIENIHRRTLPKRRDRGSHSGTDAAEGTM